MNAATRPDIRATIGANVRAAVLKALGKDSTAPAAGDDLGARYARRIGVPVTPKNHAPAKYPMNRAARRAQGHYLPLTSRERAAHPLMPYRKPIKSNEESAA